jgi:adenylyltransferase/sulfurtransferase
MTRQISVQQLAERLAAGEPTCLLDVRQEWEHQTAALPNSHLIPLDQLAARVAEVPADENGLLVVYCHHGIRSQSAAALLAFLGFANVASLAGGIDAWSLAIDPRVPRY